MASCKYCKSLLPPDPHDSIILFCPECGATIVNLEQGIERKQKYGIKKVSITRQTFFSVIPFMPFVAARRIEKLRKAIIIYSITVLLSLPIMIWVASTVNLRGLSLDFFWLGTSLYLMPSLVMVYFIRKWSMRWNKEIALLQYLD